MTKRRRKPHTQTEILAADRQRDLPSTRTGRRRLEPLPEYAIRRPVRKMRLRGRRG